MKVLSLFMLVVLSAAAAVAQAPTAPVVEPPGAEPADVATVRQETVRGCLNSANDNYTVTDQVSGKTYKITGDTTRLKQHIGQLVEISGETQTIDGPNPPEESSTGETLMLGDLREVSDTCQNGQAQLQSLPATAPILIAQRPVAPDANTNLNSAEPFSSNASDTSSSARSTRTVTTREQVSRDIKVTGRAGQHQTAVDTSTTGSAGQSTPPMNAAPGGYNASRPGGSDGSGQAVMPGSRNQPAPAPGDAVAQPGGLNPARAGNTAEEADRAAQAAARAEPRTNPQTGKTTFSTMEQSQQGAQPQAAPKSSKKSGTAQSGTNNEPK